jgi:hypothetical protein
MVLAICRMDAQEESFDLPGHFKYTSAVLDTWKISAWPHGFPVMHQPLILSHSET